MEAYVIGHFVGSEAIDAIMGRRSLIGRIARHLVLEHVGLLTKWVAVLRKLRRVRFSARSACPKW
jgi:hypothetical protein